MESKKTPPVFLERQGYRKRRIADAARVVPIIGGVLVLLPLLWPRASETSESTVGTVPAFLYVFGVWGGMIVLAAILSRWLKNVTGD